MKKVVVIVLCLLLLVICAGCQPFDITNTDLMLELVDTAIQSNSLEGNVVVNIEADVYGVSILPTNEDKITVKYVNNEKVTISINQQDNVVFILERSSMLNYIDMDNNFLLIYLPASLNIDLHIDVDTGAISVQDMAFNSITCDVDTGAIYMDDCSATTIAKLETSTGAIVADVDAEQICVDTDTGSIMVNGTAKQFDADTDTGTITVHIKAENIELSTDTGTIIATVVGNQSDYNIRIEKATGSANVQNQTVAGSNLSISAEVDTGSISIKFVAE